MDLSWWLASTERGGARTSRLRWQILKYCLFSPLSISYDNMIISVVLFCTTHSYSVGIQGCPPCKQSRIPGQIISCTMTGCTADMPAFVPSNHNISPNTHVGHAWASKCVSCGLSAYKHKCESVADDNFEAHETHETHEKVKNTPFESLIKRLLLNCVTLLVSRFKLQASSAPSKLFKVGPGARLPGLSLDPG